MKTIRNIRELNLMKQKLEYQEKLYEKELTLSAAEIVDNLALKLRDLAFDMSLRLLFQLIKSIRTADDSNVER
jgi:hypothetical protein